MRCVMGVSTPMPEKVTIVVVVVTLPVGLCGVVLPLEGILETNHEPYQSYLP